jgi:hypothetical protein
VRRLAGLGAAAALAACAPHAPLPDAPLPGGPAIRVRAKAVPQGAGDWRPQPGAFTWAGGLELSSKDTARLHGLSDLEVTTDGRLIAVSDEGDLLTARIVLDRAGRLADLADAELAPLAALDGRPIAGKAWGDSEGLAVLPNGDRLVSFELHHRVWLYPAQGGAPREAAAPAGQLPGNGGMEALSADPAAGQDAYLTASEYTGETWTCRVSGSCAPGPRLEKPPEYGVVAVRRLPGGRTAWLLRAWDGLRGNRIELRIVDSSGALLGRHTIKAPATVDNFEGLAALPRPDGSVRFFLLSDDNFQPIQRTLLVALDWRP